MNFTYLMYHVDIFDNDGSIVSREDHVLADLFDWLITYYPHPINYDIYRITEANMIYTSDLVMSFDSTKVFQNKCSMPATSTKAYVCQVTFVI